MENSKLLDVRDVLRRNSYTTTLSDLMRRGRDRVRVVHANQIAALIEEAVFRMLGEREGGGDVSEAVERTRAEFDQLLEERARELEEARAALKDLDRTRAALGNLQQECDRLRQAEARALEECEALREALESGSTEGGGGAASGSLLKMVSRLHEELAGIRASLGGAAGAAGAAQAPTGEIEKKIEAIASRLGDRLDRIGKKVGISSAVEVDPASLDRIFENEPEMESNLENLEMHEERGSDVSDAVQRARNLRRKGGSA
jgi:chromosome segregation ATPase